MAICGTCNSAVPRNCRKKIDRTVSGVCFRRVLSEYFDFNPSNSEVCAQCDHTLEQIVRINMKLEKLTIQRNTIITDFGAKISHTRVLSQTTELEVTSRTPSKQVSSTVTSETEDSSQLRSQSPSHSQPESQPVFPQIPEIKVEPLDDDDDNAAFENESSDTTEETAAKHATTPRMWEKAAGRDSDEQVDADIKGVKGSEESATEATTAQKYAHIKKLLLGENFSKTTQTHIDQSKGEKRKRKSTEPRKRDSVYERDNREEAANKNENRQGKNTEPRKRSSEKKLMCPICSRLLLNNTQLQIHMRCHTGEKPYPCEKCNKSFKCKSNLSQHMKTHGGERKYKCDQCGLSYMSPYRLSIHQNSSHSDARPYACEQCDAAFKLPSHLNRHMHIHTGQKPWKCDQCPATFIQKGNMKIHMKVHNKPNQKDTPPTEKPTAHGDANPQQNQAAPETASRVSERINSDEVKPVMV